MNDQTVNIGAIAVQRRQSLEAIKHFACRHCGAPATYRSTLDVREGWPGCYVEQGHPHENHVVGSICPNCSKRRPKDRDYGEIWSRTWRLPRLAVVVVKVCNFFQRVIHVRRR